MYAFSRGEKTSYMVQIGVPACQNKYNRPQNGPGSPNPASNSIELPKNTPVKHMYAGE